MAFLHQGGRQELSHKTLYSKNGLEEREGEKEEDEEKGKEKKRKKKENKLNK